MIETASKYIELTLFELWLIWVLALAIGYIMGRIKDKNPKQ